MADCFSLQSFPFPSGREKLCIQIDSLLEKKYENRTKKTPANDECFQYLI